MKRLTKGIALILFAVFVLAALPAYAADKGIITQEEFEEKKKELLSKAI